MQWSLQITELWIPTKDLPSVSPPWPESIITFPDLLAMSLDSTNASYRLQMGIKWAKENGLIRKYSKWFYAITKIPSQEGPPYFLECSVFRKRPLRPVTPRTCIYRWITFQFSSVNHGWDHHYLIWAFQMCESPHISLHFKLEWEQISWCSVK